MSQALDDLRNLCRKYLDECGLKYMIDQDDDFALPYAEGVTVYVSPREWTEGKTVVQVASITNRGMRVDDELGMFLAIENGTLLFGKLALYPDRPEVRVEHPLLGDWLNRAELETAVHVVAQVADDYDDKIKDRWGGKKFRET